MPSLVETITGALTEGARTGAAQLSTAGRDLVSDVETFVVPHFEDIAVQVAAIVAKHQSGIYSDITARKLLQSEADAVQVLVETIVTLAVVEVQAIVNAVFAAMAGVVNGAVGIALL